MGAPDPIPLPVRLNNPGAIRRTETVWRGQDASETGPYVRFQSPEWGFRAMAVILRAYEKRGIHTVAKAIGEWAPPHENPTEQYITNVCHDCGVDRDTLLITLVTAPMLKAIAHQECGGNYYDDATVELGIALSKDEEGRE